MPRIEEIWNRQHEEVLESADKITSAIQNMISESAGEGIGESIMEEAYEELLTSFDNEYGGFDGAPKFPTPHKIFFLLRYWRRSGNPEALHMVEYTLENMYRGGIHDHLAQVFTVTLQIICGLSPTLKRCYTTRLLLQPHTQKFIRLPERNCIRKQQKEFLTMC